MLIIKANWWRPIVKFHLGQMPLLYSFPLDTSMSVLSINTSFEMQREKHPTLVSMQSGETRQCLFTCINMDALRQSKWSFSFQCKTVLLQSNRRLHILLVRKLLEVVCMGWIETKGEVKKKKSRRLYVLVQHLATVCVYACVCPIYTKKNKRFGYYTRDEPQQEKRVTITIWQKNKRRCFSILLVHLFGWSSIALCIAYSILYFCFYFFAWHASLVQAVTSFPNNSIASIGLFQVQSCNKSRIQ